MNESCCAKLPDLNAYLARIGLAGRDLPPTLETASEIIYNHLLHIPFENLDSWDARKAPVLALDALFDKIVRHRRGGWCYEQNALLHALLSELGFEVYPVGVRVMVGHEGIPAISHRGEICVIDGQHYYCDVGFGSELFRTALPLDGTVNPYGFFVRQEGKNYVVYKRPEAPVPLLMFVDEPYEPIDYEYANYANAMQPGLLFHEHLYLSLLLPDGNRNVMFGSTFKTVREGELISSSVISDRETLQRTLAEHFALDYTLTRDL